MSNDPMRVFKLVNDQFLTLLENNIIPWKDPLKIQAPCQNYFSKHVYQGINQLVLNGFSALKGFKSPYFLTFDQCSTLGGRVRSKETHIKIAYYKKKVRKDGSEYTDLQYHKVFNLDQIEGIPKTPRLKKSFDLYKEKNIIDNYINKPNIIKGDDDFYCPIDDFIEVRDPTDFINLSYYLIKSTGHVKRFNRIASNYEDDHPLWLLEELTCQVGQGLLSALVGLSPMQDSVFKKDRETYIKTWLPLLKENPNMLINASSFARRAVGLIITGESK